MTNLGYFTLDTLDIDKARAFYGALFGWTFDPDASKPTYAHVADSNPPFGFSKVERARDFTNLYFRVDDIAAVCARISELGGKAAIPSESPSGLGAVVCDDQGVSFSLWQPAPGF
ncbi:VOC family protein [Brevundimonas sp.]|uniref:VOC family protein n=1 Tax=Brevundimonas sp. TaxID=1871086 RepID=UPI00261D0079|nr:VOC family protein [Brevundimonas sp.]